MFADRLLKPQLWLKEFLVSATVLIAGFGCTTPTAIETALAEAADEGGAAAAADATSTDPSGAEPDSDVQEQPNAPAEDATLPKPIDLNFRLYSSMDGDLVEIQTNPPAIQRIGDASLGAMVPAFAPDGKLYGVTTRIGLEGSDLYVLDPSTGEATLVAPFSLASNPQDIVSVAQIGFSPAGQLFVREYGANQPILVANLQTGVLSTTPFGALDDFAFAADGRVFSQDSKSRLISTDPATGAVTATIGADGSLKLGGVLVSYLRSMCWGPDGNLYGVSRDTYQVTGLWRIDPQTAETTLLAEFSENLEGLATR